MMAVKPPWRTAIIVMGVSGAGKSTIGTRLARALHSIYLEGDNFHPPQNVAKMHAGTPLTDDDRLPWLKAIAARIAEARNRGESLVVTCAALKRSYRDILADDHSDVGFIFLKGSKDLIAERLEHRKGHFMPPQLLDSQFADLQEPTTAEPVIVAPIDAAPDDIVQSLVEKLMIDARP
jgi:carbohydrate kinase (thermoresistant glucokinase family)